jgi:hypothetical protein
MIFFVEGYALPPSPSETMAHSLASYEELRERYRPEPIRVLLIGESPPDPGDAERRFFYAPTLSRHDNLYRGVAEALYGDTRGFSVKDKAGNLGRLREATSPAGRFPRIEHPVRAAQRGTVTLGCRGGPGLPGTP